MIRRLLALAMVPALLAAAPAPAAEEADSVLDFTMKNIDGKDVDLSKYKGDVILIVNVASKCGYTPQYAGLEDVYEKYKDQGFTILGFPANEFGAQEPGTDAEIKEFCKATYDVKFPMFSKIVVKGDGQHPLYQYLTKNHGGEIPWNFTKFLVDRDGKVIARFEPKDAPESEKVTTAIEKALAEKK
jgi:glutathione peroxidase